MVDIPPKKRRVILALVHQKLTSFRLNWGSKQLRQPRFCRRTLTEEEISTLTGNSTNNGTKASSSGKGKRVNCTEPFKYPLWVDRDRDREEDDDATSTLTTDCGSSSCSSSEDEEDKSVNRVERRLFKYSMSRLHEDEIFEKMGVITQEKMPIYDDDPPAVHITWRRQLRDNFMVDLLLE